MDDLLKYFVVHKSIYAVNIWRQSLIKLWRTPSAGAAAVSSIHNLVREGLAELCRKQVAPRGDDTNVPMLCVSQLGSLETDMKSARAAELSRSSTHCPPENPSPVICSGSKFFCGTLDTWPEHGHSLFPMLQRKNLFEKHFSPPKWHTLSFPGVSSLRLVLQM